MGPDFDNNDSYQGKQHHPTKEHWSVNLTILGALLGAIFSYLFRDLPSLRQIWQNLSGKGKLLATYGLMGFLLIVPLPIVTYLEPGNETYIGGTFTVLFFTWLLLVGPAFAWANPKLLRKFNVLSSPRQRKAKTVKLNVRDTMNKALSWLRHTLARSNFRLVHRRQQRLNPL